MPETINIWKMQHRNYVSGPGCRFVIWVQGCLLACPGCWNKHTWDFSKRNEVTVDVLFSKIAAEKKLDGLTLTGGEPFLQAKNLIPLVERVKKDLSLNIQIFTGYELAELSKRYPKRLLSLADIVVAGRFDASMPNNNQKVYEINDTKWEFNNTDVEIEIGEMGEMVVTGYPTDELIRDIREVTR